MAAKRAEREGLIAQMRDPIERVLREAGLTHAEVTGRPKHLWSIFKKMKQREKPYEEIYDLMAIRVLVNSVPECYHALGLIHEGWTPLQERIKDYIAQPKSNGYQSLHTTIFGPGKQLFEIQIRTREMHRTAEFGIAAHWLYKETARTRDELDEKLGWFREILAMQLDAKTPDEFLEFLKLDLYQDEIFVFTPTGDVIQLPKGATPIDFAFAVHTEVGLRCQGAKVNGKIAPLSRQLRNSDQVEILTSASAQPSRDWLAHVRTGRARHKIRQWIRNEEQATSAKLGREILDREVKRRRVERPGDDELLAVAKQLGLTDARHLDCLDRPGRRQRLASAEAAPPGDGGAARGAGQGGERVRAPRGSDARYHARRPDPGRRRAHDPVLPVLPARSRGSGRRLRHPRPRRQHPPLGLPEPAAAVGRAGAPARDRLAGDGG